MEAEFRRKGKKFGFMGPRVRKKGYRRLSCFWEAGLGVSLYPSRVLFFKNRRFIILFLHSLILFWENLLKDGVGGSDGVLMGFKFFISPD